MRAVIGRLWRGQSSAYRAVTLWAAVWLAILLLPYLVWGDQWGMIWFYLAWPASIVLKFLWDSDWPWSYVFVASVVQTAFLLFWPALFLTIGLRHR